jgi:tripartite-type tricarboxylate transporter receptor subunit TctC
MSKLLRRVAAFFLVAAASMVPALAQTPPGDFPTKPVRLITLTAAGGVLDVLARELARHFTERFGQPFVVENRLGASGNIGMDVVAKAPPDGYTIGMATTSTHGINPALFGSRMPFDPVKDFAPISIVAELNSVIVVHPSVPARNVAELVAYAKAHPGKLSFASGGIGSSQHLGGELLKKMAGIDMAHVPYKGLAQAMPDVLAGRVSLVFSSISDALPHIKSGKLRPIALTSKHHSALLPDVLPVAEQGYPEFNVRGWFGVVAPAGTPAEIVRLYNREIVAALSHGEVRDRLVSVGLDPVSMSPEEFAAFIKEEIKKWGEVVRVSGAKID